MRPKRTLKALRPDEAFDLASLYFKLGLRQTASRRFDKIGKEGEHYVAIYQGNKVKFDGKFPYTAQMIKFLDQQNISIDI